MPESKSTGKKILAVMGPFFGKAWGAGQQDSYYLMKILKELGHTVYLASYDYGTDREFVDRYRQLGIKVFVFPLKSDFSIWRQRGAGLRNLIYWYDPAVRPFLRLCADKDFVKLFESVQPEIVMGIQTFTFPVIMFAKKRGKIGVLRSQNLEYRHHLDMIRGGQFFNPLNYFLWGVKRMTEIAASRISSLVLAISPSELIIYKKWNPNSTLLPLCSLYEKVKDPTKRLNKSRGKINLFYAGASYNILPHLKGAEFLIEKVMPALVKIEGGDIFRLHIMGSKLPQKLANKCDGETIIYRNYVDDYESVLEEMDIGAFPTFTGCGMKQKIFEAICRGFPVVVPEKALGGYPLEHGKNILIANNCGEFVENIIRLKDVEERKKISYGAYEFAKENFNRDFYFNIVKNHLFR